MRSVILYPKLAVNGIRKNGRTYVPYILTCAGMIMMYYIISFLTCSSFIAEMRGGNMIQMVLSLGCGVMVVFSAVFLFYTNSFLIRRRKTEFGLYNILGMGKRNIAVILIWETLMVYAVSEILGLSCGILFSKLAELVLTYMMEGTASYSFDIETESVFQCLGYFAVIFALILLNGLRQIHLSKPVELLHSENTGEKPPKSNWLLAITGAVVLGIAYYMAVTIENPLAAINTFFIAVIMVIFATYMLFIAGAVFICKILQKNKKYYYKPNHFVSVSQMTYRMKRNGAGLASICILSTMLLVTVSSTISLYFGEEDILDMRYPKSFAIDSSVENEKIITLFRSAVKDTLEEFEETPENIINYSYLSIAGSFNEDTVTLDPGTNNIASSSLLDVRSIIFVTIEDYNRIMNKNEILEDGEALIYVQNGDYSYDTITFKEFDSNKTFKLKHADERFLIAGNAAVSLISSVFLFVKDSDVIGEILEIEHEIYKENASEMHNYYGFDLTCDDDKQLEINSVIVNKIKKIVSESKTSFYYSVECRQNERAEFYALYGGLFFLGILLGSVFICAAVLIMYYKQISEGFEDKSKFDILQKVGMTDAEIKKNINSQILTVFFLPLITAGIHTAFAFPLISRLLILFGLSNTSFLGLVTLGCFGVFAVFYIAVYVLTSKSYYRIVRGS